MFTKKHYKAIAEIIKDNTQSEPHSQVNEAIATGINSGGRYIALALADYFVTDNPLFNREKFLQACGITIFTDGFAD